ncbi:MAG TPA: crosslink repair DNA glycosylase YcaQ family protein, partial [Gemmatimonadales bacterium]|nr:crosslink repair DNA glycosylase YcaQ family protein [Gemmatimonadales bacterium]
YFRSHGPATLRDFVWWSGLTTPDAKRGLEMIRARELRVADKSYWTLRAASGRPRRQPAHLLPVYDEYLVAYRDRVAVPHGPSMVGSPAGGYKQFQHSLVIAGQVRGTWRVVPKGRGVQVDVAPVRRLTAVEGRAVDREIARYQRFLGLS